MIPVCRNMDSYPYQRNHIPFPPCYYPGIEANPSQMKMEPPKPHFSYEQPWHYAGSYGHPMHFCYGHNNFPGCYGYRPSYHHAPVPSPLYYSGGHPAYGEPFFIPYSPQPHYTMELPRYEYDKSMPRDYHCCWCPNHPCHQKEAKNVRVEEEEPEAGKKVNDALAPIQTENCPYPIVWIPPEYTSNKEVKSAPIAEVGEQGNTSHDRKPPGPRNFRADDQEPRVWNGWLPYDMNRVPNMVHEGDGRRNQNLEGENNRRESEDGRMNHKSKSEQKRLEFPFPIIWMPYYNKPEEVGRENNQESASTPKCIEEAPDPFKSVPVNPKADEGVTEGLRPNQVESADRRDVTKKVTNEKIIPVKEVKLHQEKNDSEGSGKRERIIPVYQMEENVTKKDSHTGGEKQSTFPPKNGKLPPVCLRVDPLPRMKNANGSSRSPSPPASKEHSKATTGEPSKAPSSLGGMNGKAQSNSNGQNAPNISEKVKPKEKTIQVSKTKTNEGSLFPSSPASEQNSQVTGGEASQTPSGSMNDHAQPNLSLQNAPNISDEKVDAQERTIQVTESKTNENKEAKESCSLGEKAENKAHKGVENTIEEALELRKAKDSSKRADKGAKEKKVLADVDAAVLIQAAYRGYQVRRWEPLKKLKQIADVSKELTDVRNHIQAIEHSPDLENDEKQRMAIGETIMRLLLKLDTIQGVDSRFREIRKSLARALISLQERLDSVMAKKLQQQTQEFADAKPVEETPMNIHTEEFMQEQQEENVAAPREDSAEGISHDVLEKCEDQCGLKDGIASQLPIAPASNGGAEPIVPPNEGVDEYNPLSDVCETDKMVVEPETKPDMENIPSEADNLDMNAWRELPVGVIDEDVTDHSSKKDEQNNHSTTMVMDQSLPAIVHDSPCSGEDSDINHMRELPVGVLDEDTATSEVEKDDGTKISKEELQREYVESLGELPVGLLDEDTVKPEFEKHEELQTPKEDLLAERGQRNADDKSSSIETSKDTQLEQQLVEEQEEEQSSGESDGWVKVKVLKDDEIKGNAPRDIEVEYEEQTRNEAELPNVATQANGDECMAVNDMKTIQPEPVESVTSAGEHVPINDFDRDVEQEEKAAQEVAQVEGQDVVAKQASNAGSEDTEALAKKKTELSAASPASKELAYVAENDGGLNGDKKLLEENEKLRKMMRKLLEAGSEQLNVITDLTGRVKDLEKKLARSKRVRTKRFRPATSKTRSNNSPSHDAAISVAM